MQTPRTTEGRLKVVGLILICALIVEALSFLGHGAIAFMIFSAAAAVLVCVGIPAYLLTLVRKDHEARRFANLQQAHSKEPS
jgi:hypothetical protein